MNHGRTYNQVHAARKYDPRKKRISIYNSWSYPAEANRDIAELDNRFSTMTEVRRVEWPFWEGPEWSARRFLQGINGALELFFRSWVSYQEVAQAVSGFAVPLYQRVDQAGYQLPLDERVLGDTDVLLLFGLDHMATEQMPSREEVEAMRHFLSREGTRLIIGPHHEVGVSEDNEVRQMEYIHHGDALVPRQQRFAAYTRALLKELDIPVENHWGLRPAVAAGSRNQIVDFNANRDADKRGWLDGVTSLNFHKHLPHYAVTDESATDVHVLAKQPIDTTRPHPFTQQGCGDFNSVVWVEPRGERAGDILFVDSTAFSTLFGQSESLKKFWHNISM